MSQKVKITLAGGHPQLAGVPRLSTTYIVRSTVPMHCKAISKYLFTAYIYNHHLKDIYICSAYIYT